MMQNLTEPEFILMDSSIISHFATAGHIGILPMALPYKMKILSMVYSELLNTPKKRAAVNTLLERNLLEKIDFPEDNIQISNEFLTLMDRFGKGESACMALSRYSKNIIAGANFKPTIAYYQKHSVPYLTTIDILHYARERDLISEYQENEFLKDNEAAKKPISLIKNENLNFKSKVLVKAVI